MSRRDGNVLIPLALGAGGGFALWHFLRAKPPTRPNEATQVSPTPAAAPPPRSGACALRLDARGLSADGAPISVDDAVQRCQAAARAEVVVTKDAPASALVDLTSALARVGVAVAAVRNRGCRNSRAAADVNLDEFARTVRRVAEEIEPDLGPSGAPSGRFGDRKAFIAAILRGLLGTDHREIAPRVVDEMLLRAHQAGLLELARADLVTAMDPDEVRRSEIVVPGGGATFHFVVCERGPSAPAPRSARDGDRSPRRVGAPALAVVARSGRRQGRGRRGGHDSGPIAHGRSLPGLHPAPAHRRGWHARCAGGRGRALSRGGNRADVLATGDALVRSIGDVVDALQAAGINVSASPAVWASANAPRRTVDDEP